MSRSVDALRQLVILLVLAALIAAVRAGTPPAAAPRRTYEIAAGDASVTLRQFVEQSGEQVVYVVPKVRGVITNAVKGAYTAREVIDRMVANTTLVVVQDEKTKALLVNRRPATERPASSADAPKPPVPDSKNPTSMKSTQPPLARFASAIALLLASPLPAQSVASATGSDTSASDETVELSPFVVKSDQDVGYLAGNTLAGSRMNTSLKDTPASISVLTAEFISDIGATSLAEALEWSNNSQLERSDTFANFTGNAAPNDNATFSDFDTFRVRGIKATITRNYFEWNLPVDSYNLDRIEESRGPNSILFGIGSAGGVVNASTKQPVTGRAFRHVSGSVGSYGTYRGTLDVNQPAFDNRLGLRFNAVYDRSETDRHHAFLNNRRVHLAAKYSLTATTRIRAEYERGAIHQVIAALNAVFDGMMPWNAQGRPTFAAPIPANTALGINRYGGAARITYIANDDLLMNMANQNFGNNTNNVLTDELIADRSISTGGPGQRRDTFINATSVFVEQQLGKHFFVELAYNHQDSKNKSHRLNTRTLTADPNQYLPNGARNPHAGGLFIDGPWIRHRQTGRSDNVRASLSADFDGGKWGKYRFAALAENEVRAFENLADVEAWEGRPFNANPENGANQVVRRNYVTEGVWETYYANGPAQLGLIRNRTDPVTGRTLSSTWVPSGVGQNDDPQYQKSLLVGGQARYFSNRLVLGFGLRKDKLDAKDRAASRNPATQAYEVDYERATDYHFNGNTRTVGGVLHFTKRTSVFYNTSSNIALPNTSIRILPNSQIAAPTKGQGFDTGFGLDFGSRLYARATYYKSEQLRGTDGRNSSDTTNPTAVARFLLDGLVAKGLIDSRAADARRSNTNGGTFDRVSEGYEFSLTANPTKNWRVQANYSYTKGYESNLVPEIVEWAARELPFYKQFDRNTVASNSRTFGQIIDDFELSLNAQLDFQGKALAGNRPHKVNVFTRYSFSEGPLKRLFVGGGYRHQSKIMIGRRTVYPDSPQYLNAEQLAAAAAATGTVVYGNSYWLADAVVGYRFDNVPLIKRLNLQLNVGNVFNYDKPLVSQIFADGRLAVGYRDTRPAISRWALLPPRTWRLSANFDF